MAGLDACELREFDLLEKEFVRDGFKIPEARNSVSWLTRDMLLVGTDQNFSNCEPATNNYVNCVECFCAPVEGQRKLLPEGQLEFELTKPIEGAPRGRDPRGACGVYHGVDLSSPPPAVLQCQLFESGLQLSFCLCIHSRQGFFIIISMPSGCPQDISWGCPQG